MSAELRAFRGVNNVRVPEAPAELHAFRGVSKASVPQHRPHAGPPGAVSW